MPAIMTSTIGGGGDYPSIAAWVADCPPDLVAADQLWKGTIIGDVTDTAPISVSKTTDSTRYLWLEVAPLLRRSSGFSGSATPFTTQWSSRFMLNYGCKVRLSGIVCVGATNTLGFLYYGADNGEYVIEDCYFQNDSADTTSEAMFGGSTNGCSATVINSIFDSFESSPYSGIIRTALTGFLYNCLFINCSHVQFGNRSSVLYRNCVRIGGSGAWVGLGEAAAGSSNNVSDKVGDAPGTDARVGTPAFSDAGAQDYTLAAADTVAKATGADLSSIFTKDFAGETRSVPWDRGPFASTRSNASAIPADLEAAVDVGVYATAAVVTRDFEVVGGTSQSIDTPTNTFAVRDPSTGYPSIRPTRGKWAWVDHKVLTRVGHTPLVTVEADAWYSSSYTPIEAFDGFVSSGDAWITPDANPGHWIEFTFPKPVRPDKYILFANSGVYAPPGWRLEGHNGTSWDILDTQTDLPAWANWEGRTFSLDLQHAYAKYRLYILPAPNFPYYEIGELEFWDDIITLDLDALEPDLRPMSVCTGGTAASNSSFSGYTPNSCFNKTTDEIGWLSANTAAGIYVQYTFTTSVRPVEYRVSLGTGLANRQIRDWTIEGYDGSSWEVVDTQSGQTGWSAQETRSYPLDLSKSYTAFRLNCIANNGGEYFGIAELDFFEIVDANGILPLPETVNFGADGSWKLPAGYWPLSVEGCIQQGVAPDEYQHILNAEVL